MQPLRFTFLFYLVLRRTYLQALCRAYLQALGGILVYWQACAAHPVQQKLALHSDGLAVLFWPLVLCPAQLVLAGFVVSYLQDLGGR